MDIDHIKEALFPADPSEGNRILDKLFSFVTLPIQQTSSNGSGTINFIPTQINHTLGGYFNKIVSFWLIKETQKMLEYIIR